MVSPPYDSARQHHAKPPDKERRCCKMTSPLCRVSQFKTVLTALKTAWVGPPPRSLIVPSIKSGQINMFPTLLLKVGQPLKTIVWHSQTCHPLLGAPQARVGQWRRGVTLWKGCLLVSEKEPRCSSMNSCLQFNYPWAPSVAQSGTPFSASHFAHFHAVRSTFDMFFRHVNEWWGCF